MKFVSSNLRESLREIRFNELSCLVVRMSPDPSFKPETRQPVNGPKCPVVAAPPEPTTMESRSGEFQVDTGTFCRPVRLGILSRRPSVFPIDWFSFSSFPSVSNFGGID